MATVSVPVEIDTSPTGYPDLDPAYAEVLRSNAEIYVEYDAQPSDDGTEIVIRRCVWTRKRHRAGQKILWVADVMVLPRSATADMVKQIVSCLVA
jgi:hypothetical protein